MHRRRRRRMTHMGDFGGRCAETGWQRAAARSARRTLPPWPGSTGWCCMSPTSFLRAFLTNFFSRGVCCKLLDHRLVPLAVTLRTGGQPQKRDTCG